MTVDAAAVEEEGTHGEEAEATETLIAEWEVEEALTDEVHAIQDHHAGETPEIAAHFENHLGSLIPMFQVVMVEDGTTEEDYLHLNHDHHQL